MRKNVLIIYLGKTGGLPKFTYELALGFAKDGFNTYAVLSDAIQNKVEWDNCRKIRKIAYIYTGNAKKVLMVFFKMLTDNKTILKESIGSIEFDYLLCTMPHPWAKYVASMLKGKRNMVICHDPIPHSGTNRLTSLILKRATMGYDDAVIMTKTFKNIMIEQYKYKEANIHYMRHGSYGYRELSCREESDNINFLFFGNICKYKGIQILLDAYERLVKISNKVTLTIAGKGNLEEYREKINSLPKLTLINRFIQESEISKLFIKSNTVVVLPYLDATQSGVIPVAMQYGAPIIASNTGGLREQLFDGEIGFLFKTGDVNNLFSIMYSLVQTPALLSDQKTKMLSYNKMMDWKFIVDNLIKEIET